jgi:hypothetical protein
MFIKPAEYNHHPRLASFASYIFLPQTRNIKRSKKVMLSMLMFASSFSNFMISDSSCNISLKFGSKVILKKGRKLNLWTKKRAVTISKLSGGLWID